jgi:geranylgeranyl reductase family protein
MLRSHGTPSVPARIRDVAIVGAGPGGSALAIELARAGLDVTLLERAEFPRDKICGDFVSPKGLALIDALGCLAAVERCGAPPITHATFIIDGERVAGGAVPQVGNWPAFGHAVPRTVLDALLASQAVAAGAELLEGFAVDAFEVEPAAVSTTSTGGTAATPSSWVRIDGRHGNAARSLRARLVVGADGARSVVAKIARVNAEVRRFGMAAVRAYAEGLPLTGSVQWFDEEFFPGYAWAFPTGPDSANVGVGVLTDGITGERVLLRRWFDRLVAHLKTYAHRHGGRLRVDEPRGWPIQSYSPDTRYSFAHGLLIGEAAGLVDPINGEGIPMAFESAALATQTIVSALEHGDFSPAALVGYDRACRERFDADLRVSDLLVSTIANRHLAPLWIHALELFARIADGDPAYAQTAGGVLAGVVPARRLFAPEMVAKTLLRAPQLLGVMLAASVPRSPSELLDRAAEWTQRAASITEGLLGDADRVHAWTRAIGQKQTELGRLLLRRLS